MNDARDQERQPLLTQSIPNKHAFTTSALPQKQAGGSTTTITTSTSTNCRASPLQQAVLIPCFTLLVLMVITKAVCVIPLQGSIAETYQAYDSVPWIVVIHSIAQSCALPLVGRLSRIFGSRLCLFVSCLLFTCGLGTIVASSHFSGFLLGRAVSGVGAGGCLTSSMIMIIEAVTLQQRAFFLAILNAGYTLGFATGATLGGHFVSQWKTAFLTQVPLILIPGTLAFFIGRSLDQTEAGVIISHPPTSPTSVMAQLGRIDYFGVLALSSALSLMLYTFNLPNFDARCTLTSMGLFGLFGFIEAKVAAEPIIPVSFLTKPHIIFSCAGILANVICWWCVLFYFPVQVIAVWGEKPSSTGAYLAPATVAFAAGGVLVGKFWTKVGGSYYWHNLLSVSTFTFTLLVFYFLPSDVGTPQWPFVVTESVSGFACAAVVSYALSELLNSVREADQAIVASLFASFRGQAGSIGGALGSSTILKATERKALQLLRARDEGTITQQHIELARRIKASPTLVWQLDGWERSLGIEAWRAGMQVVWTIGIVSGLISLTLFVATRFKKRE